MRKHSKQNNIINKDDYSTVTYHNTFFKLIFEYFEHNNFNI